MFIIDAILLLKVCVHLEFQDIFYLFILLKYERGKGGGCTYACICLVTHIQHLLRSFLLNIYET